MTEKKSKTESPFSLSGNLTSVIFVILLVIAAFIIGNLWTRVQQLEKGGGQKVADTKAGQPTIPPQAPEEVQVGDVDPAADDDWVKGDRKARIALIEYSDLQCPFCKRFHPTAQQVVDEYGGKVMWVYRHFPLDAIHPQARSAAEAIECAGKIGGNDGFWALTDAIFEKATTFAEDEILKLASEVNLDKGKIKQCLDVGETKQLVEDDYQSGTKAGVRGTPGNILLDSKTGKKQLIPGALPFEQMKQAIDQMLAEGA